VSQTINAFRQPPQRKDGPLPTGTWATSASPLSAEALGHSSLDRAVIDTKHGPPDPGIGGPLPNAAAGTPLVPMRCVS
jgi:2-keto-3-deoxy-L-rhamnonate aldolase RhmA